jgi:predicted dehydrogenase
MTAFPDTLPSPDVAPLRGGPTLRWGILAPGDIAKDFVTAMHRHTDQLAVAVAGRSADRAVAFAERHGIPRAYGNHQSLLDDSEVDIVYVASPHSEHKRLALMAIAAGKHVLVEKPIAVTAAEACEIRDAARAAGVFASEAMWTRYLPQTDVMLKLRDAGVLGDLRLIVADFGTRGNPDPTGRIYNPDLAGGALLDLGIYPVWFAHLWLGKPKAITAQGTRTSTGVDEQTSIILRYASGAQAILSTNLLAFTPARASVSGTGARIEVNPWFVVPAGFELVKPGKGDIRCQFVNDTSLHFRDGLAWEAASVARHVADGHLDSPLHPIDFSIEVLETMDEIRRQVMSDRAKGVLAD